MRVSTCNTERKTLNTAPYSPTDVRTQHVRSEADKILERRIKELTERLKSSDDRLGRQQEYLNELAEAKARQQEARNKNREENVARQNRKNKYRKEQLTTAQQEQEEKLAKIDEMKRSMLLQSKCMKVANDMRKYYLKKEIEKSKGQSITIDKLMDINERYGSGARIELSKDMPEEEARRKIVELLGSVPNAGRRQASACQSSSPRVSVHRQSAPRRSGQL